MGCRAAALREDLTKQVQLNQLGLEMLITPGELGALIRESRRPRPRALNALNLKTIKPVTVK